MSGYLEGVLVVLAINVILAYAAFLPIVAGQLNLGIAGFMATGAYISAYLTNAHGWLPLPAALAATVLTAVLGLVVAFPILRTRGIYLALATFAFGQVVVATILNLNVVGGASGYPVAAHLGFPVIAAVAVVVFVAIYLLFHTRFGISVTRGERRRARRRPDGTFGALAADLRVHDRLGGRRARGRAPGASFQLHRGAELQRAC